MQVHHAHDQRINNLPCDPLSNIPSSSKLPIPAANASGRPTSPVLSERRSRRDAHIPPSPQLRPHTMATSPSNYASSPENVRAPPVPHIRVARSRPRDHTDNPARRDHSAVEGGHLRNNGEAGDGDQEQNDSGGTELGGLRQQIELLSAEIVEFTAERDALRDMLANSRTGARAEVRDGPHRSRPCVC